MTNQYLPTNINAPRNPQETDANLTLTLDSEFVIITANAPQISLPTAVQIPSRQIYIKSVPGTGSVVGISGQTIDGSASFTFTTANEILLVKSNGVNWFIVSGGSGGAVVQSLQAAYDGGQTIDTLTATGALTIQGEARVTIESRNSVSIGAALALAGDAASYTIIQGGYGYDTVGGELHVGAGGSYTAGGGQANFYGGYGYGGDAGDALFFGGFGYGSAAGNATLQGGGHAYGAAGDARVYGGETPYAGIYAPGGDAIIRGGRADGGAYLPGKTLIQTPSSGNGSEATPVLSLASFFQPIGVSGFGGREIFLTEGDPTVVAMGDNSSSMLPSSLVLRNNAGTGELWLKTGTGSLAWTQVPTGVGLQGAYDTGPTIVTTSGVGAISFSGTEAISLVAGVSKDITISGFRSGAVNDPGDVIILGATGPGPSNGGDIFITAGAGVFDEGRGSPGNIALTAGAGDGGGSPGGDISCTTGSTTGTQGGAFTVLTGDAGDGTTGIITLTTGTAGSGIDTGIISLVTGNTTGTAVSGAVTLTTGTAVTGDSGSIDFATGTSSGGDEGVISMRQGGTAVANRLQYFTKTAIGEAANNATVVFGVAYTLDTNDTAVHLSGQITGLQTTGTDGMYSANWTASYSRSGGTVTLLAANISANSSGSADTDDPVWSMILTISGNDIQIVIQPADPGGSNQATNWAANWTAQEI